LYYADESGFSEQGYCPYAWQFADEELIVPCSHGQQINCFGLLSRDNKFHFQTTTNTINTLFVVSFFNKFVINLSKPTVVILDSAKIHHSKLFKSWISYWQSKGLYFVYLPPYSPKLNIIEILWKHIKQRWLKAEDYKDFQTLQFALHLILMDIGNNCNINFQKFNKNNYK
jgi:transposase